MATTTPCQPSNEEFNTYLITVRLLAAVGFSYLLKVLYHIIKESLIPYRLPLSAPDATAEENIGINLDDTASTSQLSLELDFDGFDGFDDGDLGIRVPEPAYHPRGRL